MGEEILDPWISTYTLQALVSKYVFIYKISAQSIIDSWPFRWTLCGRKLFEQQNFTGSRWSHPQHTRMPGPLFLQSRPSWRGAHSWLRGHIWLLRVKQITMENNTSLSALLFFIDNINTVLTLSMQFCRKFSFVAITRFLGAQKHFSGPC